MPSGNRQRDKAKGLQRVPRVRRTAQRLPIPWYVPRALEGLRGILRLSAALTAAALPVVAAGCGGSAKQDAKEPVGKFPVDVVSASFPAQQSLSQHVVMRIAVKNVGSKTVPDVGVTILDKKADDQGQGTRAHAFEEAPDAKHAGNLADPSRPVWIIDNGPVGGTSAYSNTWALGPLAPGKTRVFKWDVTSVKYGNHAIRWKVSAGLNGKALAVTPDGSKPEGTFKVSIDRRPKLEGVGPDGKVIPLQSK